MANVFDHLHLKRNTAGSSNELSFDVLDAARTGVSPRREKQRFLHPQATKASYHGVTGSSTLSGQREVESRKKKRHRQIALVWSLAIVAVLASLTAVGVVSYRYYLSVQDFNQRFNSIVDQFTQNDEFLAQVDSLMEDPLDDDMAEDRNEALAGFASARESLERTRQNAQAAVPLAVTDADQIAINQALEAADARIGMLDSAESAFNLGNGMKKITAQANATWTAMMNADQTVRESTALANAAETEDEVAQAKQATETALSQVKGVRKNLEELAFQYSDLDISAYQAYIEKKVEALGYAVQTADALLEGDRQKATDLNDAYNAADQEAAELARQLPNSFDDSVAAANEEKVAALKDAYELDRNQAIQSDSLIRSYLAA